MDDLGGAEGDGEGGIDSCDFDVVDCWVGEPGG